jgi:peptide-methionine (S)-S-oxide reductase
MRFSSLTRLGFVAALLLGAVYLGRPASAAEDAVVIPPPAQDRLNGEGTQTAVLAGGCFWGVQGVFQHTKGVINAVSGYAGGVKENAEYEKVGTGRTGHAESVQIKFDPTQISYGKILQVYFSVAHDPTQLNRQGPDSGPQYRSTIFIQNDEQRQVAEAYIAQLNAAKVYPKAIVTTIEAGKTFFPAEDYHQDYLTLHPYQPYIAYNDIPKVENLKRLFADLYRDKPVLVRDAKDTNKATN